MARYQAEIAYDGTRFHGFQRQAQVRTVQGEVETALGRLDWPGDAILGAGRTDAGVHAAGQVIAFDLTWNHPPEDLRDAMNAHLPPDVAVRRVRPARADFHPRTDAVARHYRYHLFCDPVRDPLRERYAWRVWPSVRLEPLVAAARALEGRHDFAAFGSPMHAEGSTERVVYRSGWRQRGSAFEFDIVANAFLYHMVRRLVNAQVAVGQSRVRVETIGEHLTEPPAVPIQGLAPPEGLVLLEVNYPPAEAGDGSEGVKETL